MKKTSMVLIASMVLLLAACGGGGSDAATANEPAAAVPESAGRSVAALVGYLSELLRSASDTQEPLALLGFEPPRSESAEPVVLK